MTFDAYPYTRGCTLVAMAILPAELVNEPIPAVVEKLRDPAFRHRLRTEWFPQVDDKPSLGPGWPGMILLGNVLHPRGRRWRCATSATPTTSRRSSPTPATRAAPTGSSSASTCRPRAKGSFARYLKEFVTGSGYWTWSEAAQRLSTHPAERFGLGRRGALTPGWIADIVVVDPDVSDHATYDAPGRLATGIRDVFVAGHHVLEAGELTGATPGRGICRSRRGNQ